MARGTAFSDDAWDTVNDVAQQLIDGGTGRMHWKLVALILAEVLMQTDQELESFLHSEYSVNARTKTDGILKATIAAALKEGK